MKVTKRDGSQENFKETKIKKSAERACDGLKNVDKQHIVLNAGVKLYDGITTVELDEALIKSARALIEQEPEYKYAAARLLLFTLYKEVFGESVDSDAFELQYRKSFITHLKELVKQGTVQPALLDYDLKKLSKELSIDNDQKFDYLGLQTVYDRYLARIGGKRVETPQAWLMRVAMGLALAEKPEERTKWAIKFYRKLSSFEYMSSTPTLFYSGCVRNQMSSCFLNTFDDSTFGIFDGLHQEAQKSRFAGGLGFDVTPFRAGNAYIKGTDGYTQGAVYVWKMFNDMLVCINQGGKRRGAGCAYLETWHYDIEDFLTAKRNTGDERRRTHDMNTANWIPDLFMERMAAGENWSLFSPDEVPELHELWGEEFKAKYEEYEKLGKEGKLRLYREMPARDLWKMMLKMLFETGHPWMTWKDPSNMRYSNQHCGTVHSSNLCTEILLHTKPTVFHENNDREIKEYGETAVCNLGSVNIAAHINSEGVVDYKQLGETVKLAMRMLDNVVDINFYPTQEAKNSNLRHRPVGLGSMGWHDAYYKMGIAYDSGEARKLSSDIYEHISYNAILASSELAKERGKYSTYEGSLWSKDIFPVDTYCDLEAARGRQRPSPQLLETLNWKKVRDHVKQHGMRNSNTMAIAPTATISNITGTSSCTEPYFNQVFVKTTLSGDFTTINEHLVNKLRELKKWNVETLNAIKAADGDLTQVPGLPDEVHAMFKTAFQWDTDQLLEHAAERGIWIDQGMSVNIFSDTTSLKRLSEIYRKAWDLGLKTTYYLRTKAASSVEKASVGVPLSNVEDEMPKMCSIEDPTCESCQ